MADELDRLDELLTKQEKKFARAIRDYLAVINSEPIAGLIADLIERGQTEDAIQFLASYVNQIADVVPSIWQEVGQDAAREFPKILPAVAVGISFDVTFPRAAELIRANRLLFIRNFSDAQRTAVRQALARSMMTGAGPAETARAFRGAVGLAPIQERAVANYRRLLENLNRQALDRELRDRRFDPTVERAIENDRPLTGRQIDTMVDRYRARMIMMRTENIARTEAHDAFSRARQEALDQMIEQTGIDRDRVRRIWNATRDDRTRDWHASMQGQERGIVEPFEDGLGNALRWPGDRQAPPETTISCRCTTTWRLKEAA